MIFMINEWQPSSDRTDRDGMSRAKGGRGGCHQLDAGYAGAWKEKTGTPDKNRIYHIRWDMNIPDDSSKKCAWSKIEACGTW